MGNSKINFSSVKDIKFNGQKLMTWCSDDRINSATNFLYQRCLWKRSSEFHYPAVTIIKCWDIPDITTSSGHVAKFDLCCLPCVCDSDKGIRGLYYDYDCIESPLSEQMYSARSFLLLSTCFSGDKSSCVYVGDIFAACMMLYVGEHQSFSIAVKHKHDSSAGVKLIHNFTSKEVKEWSLSDVTTKKINLYADKNNSMDSDNFITFGQKTASNVYLIDNDGSGGAWHTDFYKVKQHESDVVVAAGTPLITCNEITQSELLGGSASMDYLRGLQVTSIRNNFDEYKTKFNTATGSKYPKSEYPYLVGYIKLDCKIANYLGSGDINGTYGMYIGFKVRR